jgi:hypothetical protein
MANDLVKNGGETDHLDDDDPTKPGQGPGKDSVSVAGIVLVSVYLVGAIILCLYGMLVFWPAPTPSGGQQANQPPTSGINSSTGPATHSPTPAATPTARPEQTSTPVAATTSAATAPTATPSPTASPSATPGYVTAFGKKFEVYDEVRLLWIVIFAGALGSLIHALRSVYWYVGNRKLVWSWIGKYLMLPFAGSALAVVFYLVIRGGFFSPQAGFGNTSPFGFAAMAALVGLFSEQAVLKLQEIAETVFTKPAPGADSKPQQPTAKPKPEPPTQQPPAHPQPQPPPTKPPTPPPAAPPPVREP